jgi:hypothetical protein
MKLNEWPFKKALSKHEQEMLAGIRVAQFNFTHGFIFIGQPMPRPDAPRDPSKGMPVIICSWERPSPPAEIFYLLHHGLN